MTETVTIMRPPLLTTGQPYDDASEAARALESFLMHLIMANMLQSGSAGHIKHVLLALMRLQDAANHMQQQDAQP